jgi:excisionase family DNA binding protein
MSSNIRITKICEHCKTEFTAKTLSTRYCSHSCNCKAYKLYKLNKEIESTKKILSVNIHGKLKNIFDYTSIQNKELLTIKETCAFLNTTHVTLRRWLKDGIIQSSRVGKKHLIKRSHLNSLI